MLRHYAKSFRAHQRKARSSLRTIARNICSIDFYPFSLFQSLFAVILHDNASRQPQELDVCRPFFDGEGRSPWRDFLRATPDAASAFGRFADRVSLPIELQSLSALVLVLGRKRRAEEDSISSRLASSAGTRVLPRPCARMQHLIVVRKSRNRRIPPNAIRWILHTRCR